MSGTGLGAVTAIPGKRSGSHRESAMERSKRRRSDRLDSARGRPGASLEALERRDVMAPIPTGYNYYLPEVFPPRTVHHVSPVNGPVSPVGNAGDRLLSFQDNEGKILTGKDRQGD